MPTENRSSNTEMVSVPCEPTEEMLIAGQEAWATRPRGALEDCEEAAHIWAAMVAAAQDQPAEQHQGEPVLTLQPSDPYDERPGPWFRAEELRALMAFPAGTKLYTHPAPADPGEVERLRALRLELRKELHSTQLERDTMHAQLAERDVLLDHMAYYLSPALASHQYSMSEETMHHALSVLHDWRQLRGGTEPSPPPSCTWTYNEDSFAWDTACDESFLLMEDGPKENCMKFCPYCSKPIIQAERSLES